MTEELGPFRAIPGSHRLAIRMEPEALSDPHPDEVILSLKAGDVIVFNNTLLHTGSHNTSKRHRVFIGGSYVPAWFKSIDNFNGPNILQIIKEARERNDLRLLRLFGADNQIFVRSNQKATEPEQTLWEELIRKDKAALLD